mmetsp:Transcript_50367/g.150569  ORF Transcript_50367/g.150569 Transcript_50367/m.150569 type:complete len:256 (+) Transcript_50367:1052-1819(+)
MQPQGALQYGVAFLKFISADPPSTVPVIDREQGSQYARIVQDGAAAGLCGWLGEPIHKLLVLYDPVAVHVSLLHQQVDLLVGHGANELHDLLQLLLADGAAVIYVPLREGFLDDPCGVGRALLHLLWASVHWQLLPFFLRLLQLPANIRRVGHAPCLSHLGRFSRIPHMGCASRRADCGREMPFRDRCRGGTSPGTSDRRSGHQDAASSRGTEALRRWLEAGSRWPAAARCRAPRDHHGGHAAPAHSRAANGSGP